MPKKSYETLTFEELKVILENAEVGQLLYRIEKRGKSYVLPAEFLAFINSDHKYKSDMSRPEVISESGAAVDANWSPGLRTIYEVLGIHATINCAAVVADRVPSIKILPGYHGALSALPTSYWVSPTGPTLSSGQQGGIWISGTGANLEWVNDNGTVTESAGPTHTPFPLFIAGGGGLLGCVNDNDQTGDVNNISAIVRRVA